MTFPVPPLTPQYAIIVHISIPPVQPLASGKKTSDFQARIIDIIKPYSAIDVRL
jgi:hypothetical protein